eukprot:482723_1
MVYFLVDIYFKTQVVMNLIFLMNVHGNQWYFPNINQHYNQPLNSNALYCYISLFVLFWLHHSIFVRSSFKKMLLTNFDLSERMQLNLYILISCLFLSTICYLYGYSELPIGGGVVWNLNLSSFWNHTIWIFNVILFCIMFYESRRIKIWQSKMIQTVSIYGLCRHPSVSLTLFTYWFTPFMTVQRFVFCVVFSVFALIGLCLEEHDLVKTFGTQYIEYQKNVPMIIPYKFVIEKCCKRTN